jgi:hypothetical protein
MADAPAEAGWLEHEREQRRAWLRLTSRQRLDWLWEAKSFALRAEEARRLRQGPGAQAPRDPTAPAGSR